MNELTDLREQNANLLKQLEGLMEENARLIKDHGEYVAGKASLIDLDAFLSLLFG